MSRSRKIVGVIGGMGPAATVDFMSQVIDATPASRDQDNIHMIVENNPDVPSRQLAMRGKGKSPGPHIAEMAVRLENAGADFLVMPCNLAHAWQPDIEAVTKIPLVSIVDATVKSALDYCSDEECIGLMTTPGCFDAGLYQEAISRLGKTVVGQTQDELTETMRLVDQIKSGNLSKEIGDGLREIGQSLVDRGAKVLIAACTEFPLVLDASMFSVAFVSPTAALAEKTVALATTDEPF